MRQRALHLHSPLGLVVRLLAQGGSDTGCPVSTVAGLREHQESVRDGGGRISHLARLVAVGLSLALRAPWSAAAAAAAASGSGSVKLPGPGPGQCRRAATWQLELEL